MICLSVAPMGSSTRPVRFSLPERQYSLVPEQLVGPTERYHSAPFSMIIGTDMSVSTLLTFDGRFMKPAPPGNGGLKRG